MHASLGHRGHPIAADLLYRDPQRPSALEQFRRGTGRRSTLNHVEPFDFRGATSDRFRHWINAIDVALGSRALLFTAGHPSTRTGTERVFCWRAQIFSVQMKNVSLASTAPCPADVARNG